MGNLSFFENMVENKLLNIHTAFLGKVISVNGSTAKIQPLGMAKAYGENAQKQSPLSNVPIAQSARYKMSKETITYVSGISTTYADGYVSSVTPTKKSIDVIKAVAISSGDIVICVCCDRDITEAKKGNNATPCVGHHSMSDSVIIGIL